MDTVAKQEFESVTVFRGQPSQSMPDSENSNCETRNISAVNGYIVYTGTKRSQDSCNSFSKRFRSCDEVKANAKLRVKLENECNDLKNEVSEVVVRTLYKRFTRSTLKGNVADNGDDKADGGMKGFVRETQPGVVCDISVGRVPHALNLLGLMKRSS